MTYVKIDQNFTSIVEGHKYRVANDEQIPAKTLCFVPLAKKL